MMHSISFKPLFLIVILLAVGVLSPTLISDANDNQFELIQQYGDVAMYDVQVVGQTAYITTEQALLTLDVSNQNAPETLDSITLLEETDAPPENYIFSSMNLEVTDNVAFVLSSTGVFAAVDISDPTSLALLDTIQFNAKPEILKVVDDKAYITVPYSLNESDLEGLLIFDVSDPANLTLVSTTKTSGPVVGVFVKGNIAYVIDSWVGMYVLDVSDPTTPVEIGAFFEGGYKEVIVHNDIAYLSSYQRGLVTVDVSDPTSPKRLSAATILPDVNGTVLRATYGMEIADDIVYMADVNRGLIAVDVSDPTMPIFVTAFNLEDAPRGIDIEDGIIYLSAAADPNSPSSDGLYLFNILTEGRELLPCPEIGMWPEGCVSDLSESDGTGEPCPESGVWPAGCIPGEACPASGVWPAGCIPNAQPPVDPSMENGAVPCPAVGVWPKECTPH